MRIKSCIKRLNFGFYQRDVLTVAAGLLGKVLVRHFENGLVERYVITEVEAYRGEEDAACHAHKGRTPRTEVMYDQGGCIYVYLIYGMYWMLNVVTGDKDHPQAVLIRSVKGIEGPGRLGRALQLDKSFYAEDLLTSERLWIEKAGDFNLEDVKCSPRIGIDYAPDEWRIKPWRFVIEK